MSASRARRRRAGPAVELLESRRLLSSYNGPSANRPLLTPAGAFQIQLSGPGAVEVHHAANGVVDLQVYGTTINSTLTITQTQPRYHAASQLLSIRNLRIRSGQLGGLLATPVDLEGRMTPLSGTVNTFDIGTIGPKAQVDINGSVGSLSVSSIDLGPTGHVAIAGDINSIAQAGPTSTTTPALPLIGALTGAVNSLAQAGAMTIGAITIDGGRFSIGRDSLASIAINGDVDISHDGSFSIGRDQDGTFTVDGSVRLGSGGQLVIGRNLGSLAINGNLVVQPSGGGVAVDGALESLTINGYFQGQGGTSAPSTVDLGVGLNLSGLTILGGVSGKGGLINANVRVGGSVSGVNVAYGTYNSTIQSNTTMPA